MVFLEKRFLILTLRKKHFIPSKIYQNCKMQKGKYPLPGGQTFEKFDKQVLT
jgi:hypothetical protein